MKRIWMCVLLLSAPALAQPADLVGTWGQSGDQSPGGAEVRLSFLADGRFELTGQARVTQDLLADTSLLGGQVAASGLLDSSAAAAFPFELDVTLTASGTWTATGDQLTTQLDVLDVAVSEPGADRLGLTLHVAAAQGMEMTAHLRVDQALMQALGDTAGTGAGPALPEGVALPESLAVSLHVALAWQTGEDAPPPQVEALDVLINGLDLGAFMAQNRVAVTAVVEAVAAALGPQLGVTEEDLPAFQAELVRSLVTEFDQNAFEASLGTLLASSFDATTFQADLTSSLSGAYRVDGTQLSVTDADGAVSQWTRVPVGSAVTLTSWGQVKAAERR